MDNGVQQQEMAQQLKREVKRSARLRHREHPVMEARAESSLEDSIKHDWATSGICLVSNLLEPPELPMNEASECPAGAASRGLQHTLTHVRETLSPQLGTLRPSEARLFTFYLETLHPFLYPFYRPSHFQGGRFWILEMMRRPVLRQVVLGQSSYFLSLAQKAAPGHQLRWEQALEHTTGAFEVLGGALRIINSSNILYHLHGAVRVLVSIMEVLRFEVMLSSFQNWQLHLTAALALFSQLMSTHSDTEGLGSIFSIVVSRLSFASTPHFPSAEQAAFRFSSTLLLFVDVIASTALQTEPRLRKYHADLLATTNNEGNSAIEIEAVVGVSSTILHDIGEISTLAAWKKKHKEAGSLDTMELLRRASTIEEALLRELGQLELDETSLPKSESPLDVFTAPSFPRCTIGQVWINAAFIYLSTVVSDSKPTHVNIRNNVQRIVDIFNELISIRLLPSMVWPFCVAGCLAEVAQEHHFRSMAAALDPPDMFSTVNKALQIMENVWQARSTDIDYLASCFLLDDDLILLV
jgi:hypothetical protein